MGRFTKKIRNDYTYKYKYNQAYHKLGKLEDIEEELGCPLEVVFKALMNGIHIIDLDYKVEIELLRHFHNLIIYVYDNDNEYDLKDYKKTWWLKENREE